MYLVHPGMSGKKEFTSTARWEKHWAIFGATSEILGEPLVIKTLFLYI